MIVAPVTYELHPKPIAMTDWYAVDGVKPTSAIEVERVPVYIITTKS